MQGYEVVVAEDGLDALQCLSGPLPELLITDLRMPLITPASRKTTLNP